MWMANQETILPETDFVMLAKSKTSDGGYRGDHPPMPWAEAMAKHGHLVQKLDGFPNLYRASPFEGDNAIIAEAA
jgi:hypothetical protein